MNKIQDNRVKARIYLRENENIIHEFFEKKKEIKDMEWELKKINKSIEIIENVNSETRQQAIQPRQNPCFPWYRRKQMALGSEFAWMDKNAIVASSVCHLAHSDIALRHSKVYAQSHEKS